jgi:hypothetical protein
MRCYFTLFFLLIPLASCVPEKDQTQTKSGPALTGEEARQALLKMYQAQRRHPLLNELPRTCWHELESASLAGCAERPGCFSCGAWYLDLNDRSFSFAYEYGLGGHLQCNGKFARVEGRWQAEVSSGSRACKGHVKD